MPLRGEQVKSCCRELNDAAVRHAGIKFLDLFGSLQSPPQLIFARNHVPTQFVQHHWPHLFNGVHTHSFVTPQIISTFPRIWRTTTVSVTLLCSSRLIFRRTECVVQFTKKFVQKKTNLWKKVLSKLSTLNLFCHINESYQYSHQLLSRRINQHPELISCNSFFPTQEQMVQRKSLNPARWIAVRRP